MYYLIISAYNSFCILCSNIKFQNIKSSSFDRFRTNFLNIKYNCCLSLVFGRFSCIFNSNLNIKVLFNGFWPILSPFLKSKYYIICLFNFPYFKLFLYFNLYSFLCFAGLAREHSDKMRGTRERYPEWKLSAHIFNRGRTSILSQRRRIYSAFENDLSD
jgi:hypothetical protein